MIGLVHYPCTNFNYKMFAPAVFFFPSFLYALLDYQTVVVQRLLLCCLRRKKKVKKKKKVWNNGRKLEVAV